MRLRPNIKRLKRYGGKAAEKAEAGKGRKLSKSRCAGGNAEDYEQAISIYEGLGLTIRIARNGLWPAMKKPKKRLAMP